MNEVPVDDFRRRLSDYVARAEAGAIFVLLRHGSPVAILGPASPEDGDVPLSVSRFRATLRRSIRRSATQPLRLTYRGRTVALVGPVPAHIGARWKEPS